MPRINIQYSIDMEDLPTEVKRLYSKASKMLHNISLIEYADSQMLTSSVVNHIHETRLELAKADALLGDVQAVVNSYVEYEMSQLSESNAAPPHPEMPPPMTEEAMPGPTTLDDIGATIQSIKESIEHEKPPQRSP